MLLIIEPNNLVRVHLLLIPHCDLLLNDTLKYLPRKIRRSFLVIWDFKEAELSRKFIFVYFTFCFGWWTLVITVQSYRYRRYRKLDTAWNLFSHFMVFVSSKGNTAEMPLLSGSLSFQLSIKSVLVQLSLFLSYFIPHKWEIYFECVFPAW